MTLARARLDSLTKPPGSLGRLEEIAIQLAGITGQPLVRLGERIVIVMAGDHGVVAEGVSAYPSEVTAQMLLNFVRGGAGVNVLARQVGARIVVANLGCASEVSDPSIENKRIRRGTGNIARGPAMTRQEAIAALEAGSEIATRQIAGSSPDGVPVLALGEMGIGNTTSASAILAAIGGFPAERVVGPGTGLTAERVKHKAAVVARALEVNRPSPDDGLDVLAKVGGLEIGGLAGSIIAAAASRVPVVLDGFISGAAALIAAKIAPASRAYMIPSHASAEPGHRLVLALLGLRPMLEMDLRLGEGTGAVLAMPLIEAATRIIAEMATFTEAGVSGPA